MVETNYLLSLAEVVKLKMPIGSHRIKVSVNGIEDQEKTFELNRKLYIAARYFRDPMPDLNIPKGVMIEISDHPFIYD